MSIPTRAELDALISERLASDPNYRQALLDDPRAAVTELVGTDVPAAVHVTVHEESLTDIHLAIHASSSGEIAEDDLELVAGGGCWSNAGIPEDSMHTNPQLPIIK